LVRRRAASATVNDVGLNEGFPLSSFMGDFLNVEKERLQAG
jgi:hypothetical protein